MQDDIFMGPGMLDMHSHSIDLFDTHVKPHLTWLCRCMPASIAGCFMPKQWEIVSFLTDEKF